MENINQDQTFKFFIIIGGVLGAINGLISLVEYLEDKEIAQKKLRFEKKKKQNQV